jgi:hypothetical protein
MNTEIGYIEMYSKNSKSNVRVYSFLVVDNKAMAMIFNPNALPNPWSYVKVNNLVPLEYTSAIQGDAYISKTKRNRAKGRMKILDATWQTSDGQTWSHENIEDAIAHELELMEKEKEHPKENGNEEQG